MTRPARQPDVEQPADLDVDRPLDLDVEQPADEQVEASPSSGIEAKAARLLTAGRVTVRQVAPGIVDAQVEGDTGAHTVSGRGYDRWECDCQAFTFRRRCSHQTAVANVEALVVRDEPAPATVPALARPAAAKRGWRRKLMPGATVAERARGLTGDDVPEPLRTVLAL